MQPVAPVGEDRAYLDFVLGLKQYFASELYPRLRQQYDAHADAQPAGPAASRLPSGPDERYVRFGASAAMGSGGRIGSEVASGTSDVGGGAGVGQVSSGPRSVGAVVEDLPAYALFQWLERNTQKMMWRRLEAMIRPRVAELDAELERAPSEPRGSLELDPNLLLPDYYAQTEFHIQPGGVWSSAANAFVYEVGAKVVMMGQNDDYRFHRQFVTQAIPHQDYRAILDLGCGFGKSTRPFVDAFPEASVVGIDLSAPNLKLARQQAERLGKRIAFYQRAAEATGFPAASFDLVTATMLIHEMPMPVLRRVLGEALRILRPGGLLAVLDFAHTGDPFRDFIMDGHGARNNEPYLPHLFKTDVRRLLQDVGFEQPEMLPFDERGGGVRADGTWPERAEWHFPWVVIRARKAA